jgi:hypothetical protein
MSHFCVLVIGKNVERQLAPYHEFECTGNDDEFVKDIDVTEEYRKRYLEAKKTLLVNAEGQEFNPYDAQFYREPTEDECKKHGFNGIMVGSGGAAGISWTSRDWNDGQGHRAKVHFMPEGFTEVEHKASEVQSFLEYLKDDGFDEARMINVSALTVGGHAADNDACKYGYIVVNDDNEVVQVISRTNPNAKWDWWVIGGRWSGFLRVRPGAPAALGEPGIYGIESREGHADIVRKGDVDFEAMRNDAAEAAAAAYDRVHAVIQGRPFQTWEQTLEEYQVKAAEGRERGERASKAREAYANQDVIKDLHEAKVYEDADEFLMSRAEYIENERNQAVTTFAVVKDGQWYAKGDMGWWGVVHDPVDQLEWNRRFWELLRDLPDDTQLTVVDCHI